MNKPINLRFALLQARFPSLYAEAQSKINGGVKGADILADWLNELVCRRGLNEALPATIISQNEPDDLDLAIKAMEAL
jgi:hypothetical protein